MGYASDIHQPVPCFADGSSQHKAIPPAQRADPGLLFLPAGYIHADSGTLGVRDGWTASVATNPNTWSTTSVLKYSQSEILARGQAAEDIREQVRSFRRTVLIQSRCVSVGLVCAPPFLYGGTTCLGRALVYSGAHSRAVHHQVRSAADRLC